MSWALEKAKLSTKTLDAINRLGFDKPTPVQNATIPLFLNHKDVVVEAVTGSGKTLAFAIPILEMLSQRKPPLSKGQVGAIIISPTRELALQTRDVFMEFLPSQMGLSLLTMIGGTDVSTDIKNSREHGCNIIVATPGRLLDMMDKHSDLFEIKTLEVLVLDEADRLLNLGFSQAINSIIERLPKQRRTGLFSATMSDALSELIRTGLRNPVRVTVKVESRDQKGHEQKTPESLKSYYTICEYEERLPFLLNYLCEHPTGKKSIVYFATCASVDYFLRAVPLLPPANSSQMPRVFALHGKMDSKRRTKIHAEFQAYQGKCTLFCTDLAARGLDFADVDNVIQYDAPQDPSTFVHRCGRTARVGRVGEALLLLAEVEDAYIEFLSNRKVPVNHLSILPTNSGGNGSFFEKLRELNSNDRDFLDRSIKAFVAFIRFYQEHHAKFIFRLKDLDIGAVAKSFGLLQMPKMRELAGIAVANFVPSSAQIASIAYKDPNRNRQREISFKALKARKDNNKSAARQNKNQASAVPSTDRASGMDGRFGGKREALPTATKQLPNNVDMEELDDDWKEYKRARVTKK